MASSKRMHWAWAGVFLLGARHAHRRRASTATSGTTRAILLRSCARISPRSGSLPLSTCIRRSIIGWRMRCIWRWGESILAYRLLSVAGMVATALLGPVVVRRMFGERAGLAFSALVLFLPFSQHMAWQIRMYSWSMFTVSVCFLAALRLMSAAHANERAPRIAWAALGASGIASGVSALLRCGCGVSHQRGAHALLLAVRPAQASRVGGTRRGAARALPPVGAHAHGSDGRGRELVLDHVRVSVHDRFGAHVPVHHRHAKLRPYRPVGGARARMPRSPAGRAALPSACGGAGCLG